MIRRRWVLVAAVAAAVAALALPNASPISATGERHPDVRLALLLTNGCGTFTDNLAPIVTMQGAHAGDRSPPVGVCVRNVGAAIGRATLTAVDRVDTEIACTADEPDVDASCAPGELGELGAGLGHVVARDQACRRQMKGSSEATFAQLVTSPLVLYEKLRPGETRCVSVSVVYRPAGPTAESAAQSDRVTWRYRFQLVSR